MNTCNVQDPVTELEWIDEQIQQLEKETESLSQYFYLTQGLVNNETVFVFGNCCPFCNTISFVQNCEGEVLGTLGSDIAFEALTDTKVIWKHPDSSCSL